MSDRVPATSWLLRIGGLLVVVGTFLPWFSHELLSVSGWELQAFSVPIAGLSLIAMSFVESSNLAPPVVVVFLAAIPAVVAGELFFVGIDGPGMGLWVVAAGCVLCVVGAARMLSDWLQQARAQPSNFTST